MEIQRDTRLLSAEETPSWEGAAEQAAQVIKQGGLVALPTETVYGIGANALDPQAVADIFAAKGRPQDNPLICHIADMEALAPLVTQVTPVGARLAAVFWPGPLTMIFEKSDIIPGIVSAGLDTVAVRMPSHPVAREIIRRSGVPVAGPSANLSGKPSPTTAAHCVTDLWGRVDLIVDGGSCPVGLESTVVLVTGDVPKVLRPGAVTPEQIRQAAGDVILDSGVLHHVEDDAKVSSPGMKYKHYAPKAKVVLLSGSGEQVREFLAARQGEEGLWALLFQEEMDTSPVPAMSLGAQGDPAQQGARLFAALRELDDMGARTVYARTPAKEGLGLAVYNRLVRAAGFCEIDLNGSEER